MLKVQWNLCTHCIICVIHFIHLFGNFMQNKQESFQDSIQIDGLQEEHLFWYLASLLIMFDLHYSDTFELSEACSNSLINISRTNSLCILPLPASISISIFALPPNTKRKDCKINDKNQWYHIHSQESTTKSVQDASSAQLKSHQMSISLESEVCRLESHNRELKEGFSLMRWSTTHSLLFYIYFFSSFFLLFFLFIVWYAWTIYALSYMAIISFEGRKKSSICMHDIGKLPSHITGQNASKYVVH